MPQQQVAYIMAPQPVTYAVPEGAYTVPEGEMMTAPAAEMPAVTYMPAQPQMIYAAPATGLSYEGAPAGAVMLGGTEYAPGASYTYLDYDNAYFPDEAPITAVTTEVETVAPVAAAPTKAAEKISKKKSKKTKVSSKKKGCC